MKPFRTPDTAGRRIAFRLLAVLVVLMPFLLMEAGLRLWWPSERQPQ